MAHQHPSTQATGETRPGFIHRPENRGLSTGKAASLALLSAAVALPGLSANQIFISEEYSDFMAAIASDYHLEDFSSLDFVGAFEAPFVTEGGNGFGWTLNSESDELWSLGNALSVDSPNDSLTFTFTGRAVYAFGADFWGTDYNGAAVPAVIEFVTNSGVTVSHPVPLGTGFIGVITSEAIESVTVSATSEVQTWPTTTNVITAIPEPATAVLFLGATALAVGVWSRRRTAPKPHQPPSVS